MRTIFHSHNNFPFSQQFYSIASILPNDYNFTLFFILALLCFCTLQKYLNPEKEYLKEKQFGDTVFREQDRVMQIKNNYDIYWEKK